MIVEGRTPALACGASIETTHSQIIVGLQVHFGLNTVHEPRLLDQHIAHETNCQVASFYSHLFFITQ